MYLRWERSEFSEHWKLSLSFQVRPNLNTEAEFCVSVSFSVSFHCYDFSRDYIRSDYLVCSLFFSFFFFFYLQNDQKWCSYIFDRLCSLLLHYGPSLVAFAFSSALEETYWPKEARQWTDSKNPTPLYRSFHYFMLVGLTWTGFDFIGSYKSKI